MNVLMEKIKEKIPGLREDIKKLLKEYGQKEISKVIVANAYGGMRGVKSLVCDTSSVPPDKGLIIRNIPIKELTNKYPEEIFYLLCTGELPSKEDFEALKEEFGKRSSVPEYVWNVLDAMPSDSHPMVMLNTAILVMERESEFRKEYNKGIKKNQYWESTLEDAITIIARMPVISAWIYRKKYGKGSRIEPDAKMDLGANYVYMLGISDPNGEVTKLMRLYFVLHSDHEGGNVSAMTSATVNSALSDLYYALSAGLNGLAGPLHGLANQECLKWVLTVRDKFNGVPSDEELRKFAWDTLNSGKVIPGYGHAVLRITDPRFDAFLEFGKKYCANDDVFRIVEKVFNIVPNVLREQGKAKDPWPNVDASSGSLLYHYGIKEFEYYTVLFSISRALGICSQAVIARAMGYPIIRPKSVTTQWIKNTVSKTTATV